MKGEVAALASGAVEGVACRRVFTLVFVVTELDSKLQAAESRCKVLEKQLDYMRKMVENAKEKRNALMEDQVINI